MTVSSNEKYFTLYSDGEDSDRKKIIDEVRLYHPFEDNNDFIIGVKQEYDQETFENIGEAEIINL